MTRGLENKRTIGDHPNHCIVEITPNTKKSPGDLKTLPVTQNQLEGHQIMLN